MHPKTLSLLPSTKLVIGSLEAGIILQTSVSGSAQSWSHGKCHDISSNFTVAVIDKKLVDLFPGFIGNLLQCYTQQVAAWRPAFSLPHTIGRALNGPPSNIARQRTPIKHVRGLSTSTLLLL
jgi:hypothetical protein